MLPTSESMTIMECKRVLRRLELEAYCGIVNAFRAQGELSPAKKDFLESIQNILSISTERHKAEVRRAVNDDTLTSICETINGSSSSLEWSIEGRRLVPYMPRSIPETAYLEIADRAAREAQAQNRAERLAQEQRRKKVVPEVLEDPPPSKPVGDHIVLPAGTRLPAKSVMDHPDPDKLFKPRQIEPSTKNLPFLSIALGSRATGKSAPTKRPSSSTPDHPPSSKAPKVERLRPEPEKKSRKTSTEGSHQKAGSNKKGSHHQSPGGTPYSPGHHHNPFIPVAPVGAKQSPAQTSPTLLSKPHFLHTALTTGQEPTGKQPKHLGTPGREKDPHHPAWREPSKKHTPGIVRKSSKSKHHKHHSSKQGHAAPQPVAGDGTPVHPSVSPKHPSDGSKGTSPKGGVEPAKRVPSSSKMESHRDKTTTKIKSPVPVPLVAPSGGKVTPPVSSGPGVIYKVTTVGVTTPARSTVISSAAANASPVNPVTVSSLAMPATTKYTPLFTSPKVPPYSAAQIVKLTSKNLQQRTAIMQKAGLPGKGNVIVVQKSSANAKAPSLVSPEAMSSVMARPKIVMTTTSGSSTLPHPSHGSIRFPSPTTKAQSPIVMSPGGRVRQIIRTAIPSTSPSGSGPQKSPISTTGMARGPAAIKEYKMSPAGPGGQASPVTRLGPPGTKWTMVSSGGYMPYGATMAIGQKGRGGGSASVYQPGMVQKASIRGPGHHVVIPLDQKGQKSHPIGGSPQGHQRTGPTGSGNQSRTSVIGKRHPQQSVASWEAGLQTSHQSGEPQLSEGPRVVTSGVPPGSASPGPTTGVNTALAAKLLKGASGLKVIAGRDMGVVASKGPEQGGAVSNPVGESLSTGKPLMYMTTTKQKGASFPSYPAGHPTGQSPMDQRRRLGPSEQSAESAARALLDIGGQIPGQQAEVSQLPMPSTSSASMVTAKQQSTGARAQTLQMLSKSLKKATKGDTHLMTIEDQGVVPKRVNLSLSDMSEFVDQYEEFLVREGLSEHPPGPKGMKRGSLKQQTTTMGMRRPPPSPGQQLSKGLLEVIKPAGSTTVAKIISKPTAVRIGSGQDQNTVKQVIPGKNEPKNPNPTNAKLTVMTSKQVLPHSLQTVPAALGSSPKTFLKTVPVANISQAAATLSHAGTRKPLVGAIQSANVTLQTVPVTNILQAATLSHAGTRKPPVGAIQSAGVTPQRPTAASKPKVVVTKPLVGRGGLETSQPVTSVEVPAPTLPSTSLGGGGPVPPTMPLVGVANIPKGVDAKAVGGMPIPAIPQCPEARQDSRPAKAPAVLRPPVSGASAPVSLPAKTAKPSECPEPPSKGIPRSKTPDRPADSSLKVASSPSTSLDQPKNVNIPISGAALSKVPQESGSSPFKLHDSQQSGSSSLAKSASLPPELEKPLDISEGSELKSSDSTPFKAAIPQGLCEPSMMSGQPRYVLPHVPNPPKGHLQLSDPPATYVSNFDSEKKASDQPKKVDAQVKATDLPKKTSDSQMQASDLQIKTPELPKEAPVPHLEPSDSQRKTSDFTGKVSDPPTKTSDSLVKASDLVMEASEPQLKASDPPTNTSDPRLVLPYPAMKAIDPQLKTSEQQLKASDTQMRASDPKTEISDLQMKASDPPKDTSDPQLKASHPQLKVSDSRMKASDPQMKASDAPRETSDSQLKASDAPMETSDSQLKASDPHDKASDPQRKAADSQIKASDTQLKPTDSSMKVSDPQFGISNPPQRKTGPQIKSSDSQSKASDSPSKASDSQLKASGLPMEASVPQLKASDPQLKASDPKLDPSDPQLNPSDPQLKTSDPQLKKSDTKFKPFDTPLKPSDSKLKMPDLQKKATDPFKWEEAGDDPKMSDLIRAISQPKVSLIKIKQQEKMFTPAEVGADQVPLVVSPQRSARVVLESSSSFNVSPTKLEGDTKSPPSGSPKVKYLGPKVIIEGGKKMPKPEASSWAEVGSDATPSGSDSSYSDMSGSETHQLRASKRRRKAPTPIDEETGPSSMPSWARAAWNMLLRVMRFRGANRAKGDINAASWFNRPVDPKESPDYFKIIKSPMDFSTVKRNLENGIYQGFPDFHHDMIMVRRNCLKFNPPGHRARKDCDEVFQFYQEEYNKAIERWGKGQGTPKSPKRLRPDPAPK